MYICLSQRNFLYIVIVSVSINSILSIIIKHIRLIIFCNDDRDQMLGGYWHVFLYIILFNCKMPMQVLFQIKFPQNRCLVTIENTGIHHIGAPDDLIVFIVFPSVWGHFLVFIVNVS